MDGGTELQIGPAEIKASGRITEEDIGVLRRGVFRDGIVDWDEARMVIDLHGACAERADAWDQFYVEALTDFLVWSAKPRKFVDGAKARFIREAILKDGQVDSATELALLINVVHWAASCPEDLVELVVAAVHDSVLSPDDAAYGRGRKRNQIDDIDVALLRKVVFAGASDGGFTVSRWEAEMLLSLHDATRKADNSNDWRDLFVKGVANYLMFPRGAPAVPNAEEFAQREEWLAERRGAGQVLLNVVKNVGSLDYARVWREADVFGTRQALRRERLQATRMADAFRREGIDGAEAAWVLDWLATDGDLHPNERALLNFIADNATVVPKKLAEFMAEKGIVAPAAAQ